MCAPRLPASLTSAVLWAASTLLSDQPVGLRPRRYSAPPVPSTTGPGGLWRGTPLRGLLWCGLVGTVWLVSDVLAQPRITWPPREMGQMLGRPALFTVVAEGLPPLRHQWRKDDLPLAGETNDTLYIPEVQSAHAGLYSVEVADDAGTVLSDAVRLAVRAPRPDDVDVSFVLGPALRNVRAIVVQPDRRILVGGDFIVVGGGIHRGVARLLPDGRTDQTFAAGLNAVATLKTWPRVMALALQPDGKVVVGGKLSAWSTNMLARLNPDGSLDGAFLDGMAGPNNAVRSVALEPDGHILIGGDFTAVNRNTRVGIARLHPDGSTDLTFLPSQTGPYADRIVVQEDGRILASGTLTCLLPNGAVDAAFRDTLKLGAGTVGARGVAYTFARQPDGRILIGGSFGSVNAVARTNLARIHPNGTLDPSFASGLDPLASIDLVAVQSDGRVLVRRTLSGYDHTARHEVTRLHADGSLDRRLIAGDAEANGPIYTVVPDADGTVLLGGDFTTIKGVPRAGVARLDADGNVDIGFLHPSSPAPDRTSQVAAAQPDGKILLAGPFTSVGGVARGGLARFHSDGSLDQGFFEGLKGVGLGGAIHALRVQLDGRILVGGSFRSMNGTDRNNLARLLDDGSVDTSFLGPTNGPDAAVHAVVLEPDGRMLIGGAFVSVHGVSRNRLARLQADGSLDTSFLAGRIGANGIVRAILVESAGTILIGGDFTSVNAALHGGIARLRANGDAVPEFQTRVTGGPARVYALAKQSDGRILIAGAFTAVDGVARSGVARLNNDGTVDLTFLEGLGATSGDVTSVHVLADGMVLIAGHFFSVQGRSCGGLARLKADGTLNPDAFGYIDPMGVVLTDFMLPLADGKIVAGIYLSTPLLVRYYGDAVERAPALAIGRTGDQVVLSWPTTAVGYRVEGTPALEPARWHPQSDTIRTVGDRFELALPPKESAQFFRLAKP